MTIDRLLNARERSVGHLQTLYVIVISIAITVILQSLIKTIMDKGPTNFGDYYHHVSVFFAFIVTIVPFAHGSNRYLDATYITSERKTPANLLLFDFLFLFLQAILLFVMAVLSLYRDAFYVMLIILLVIDVLWVVTTCFTSKDNGANQSLHIRWIIINLITIILFSLFLWSTFLGKDIWQTEHVKSSALMFLAVARTLCDYFLVLNFYYPIKPEALTE